MTRRWKLVEGGRSRQGATRAAVIEEEAKIKSAEAAKTESEAKRAVAGTDHRSDGGSPGLRVPPGHGNPNSKTVIAVGLRLSRHVQDERQTPGVIRPAPGSSWTGARRREVATCRSLSGH